MPRCGWWRQGEGYPNLNDDEWIWGGNLDEIAQTIRHGVRSGDADARQGAAMPAFGRDGILKRANVENVGDFVRSLAGVAPDPGTEISRPARRSFPTIARSAMVRTGKGKRELGAPNLSDAIWLYGADKPSIVEAIWNGRGGVMPAWAGRLDDVTIREKTVYVHSLGGGEK